MSDSLSQLLLCRRPAASEVALTADGARSWAHFLGGVACCAARLAARREKRFALFTEDSFLAACALFGAWAAGKTVVLPGDELPATRALLEGRVAGWIDPAAIDCAAPVSALPVIPADHPAIEVFTSGSTGEPVAIGKTLAQLEAEVREIDARWGEQIAGKRVLATVPHQHFYGLLFRILWPLAANRPFDALRFAFPEPLAARLAEAPAVLVSSPAFLKRWPDALDLSAAPCPPHAIFSSGGPLPTASSLTLQQRLGCPVFEIFGSSETGGIAWRVQRDDATPWQTHPVVELDFSGETLALRSPFMPDAAQWYPTSDRAEACPGGFRLLGRADRIVKVEEKRVSLDAIERSLLATCDVTEARVCPLADGRLGAVLVLSPAGKAYLAEQGRAALNRHLRSALARSLEAVALPRRWRHVEALPVNAMGKITSASLRALFEDVLQPEVLASGGSGGLRTFDVLAGEDLLAFRGHFPAMPILPGVVQLDWVIRFARQSFALPGEFSAIEVLKFQQPIRPGMALRIALEWLPARSAVAFRLTSGERPLASGRMVFAGARS
ncbi:AMP-binding protein [Niveibacterium terrae]|uniref:AMP-binding protein n=1 Tax=Niveibacterium terrae TaxID=3373598 RepID=UPI003A8CD5CF